jgi:pyruvate dehydrogenase E2 component (dihydrolipoamide acetyltransferase)
MAQVTQVAVPDIGEFTDVPVIEVLVAEGDAIEADAPLVTLESDKATMEIPAPIAGVVEKLLVKLGDKVSEGSPIATIAAEGNGQPAPAGEAPLDAAPATTELAPEPPETLEPEADGGPPSGGVSPRPDGAAPPAYASPLARRMAREFGVDLASVKGTGRNGRIVRADIEAAAGGGVSPRQAGDTGLPGLAPWPTVDFARYGEIERVPLSRIQKISGPNLARNWVMIPHVTHHEEADITDLEAFRKEINAEHPETKVTMVALLMKAVIASLQAFPDFNASLDGDALVRKRYWNIGFAADTPQGLMVPVIRDVDKKGLLQVATELRELSGKAREGKLGPAEMQGATFTISSLGGIGGTGFTPIINAPEVAILGVTRTATKPVWSGSEFVPRLIVPLSLSYDHRVIDGAKAARFMVHLAGVLGDLRRVLL